MNVQVKVVDAHSSPLYKVKPLDENLIATGDEDGTVKLWDKRHKMTKPVMEDSDSLCDAVTDIFFDSNVDPKYMVVSSLEGNFQVRCRVFITILHHCFSFFQALYKGLIWLVRNQTCNPKVTVRT